MLKEYYYSFRELYSTCDKVFGISEVHESNTGPSRICTHCFTRYSKKTKCLFNACAQLGTAKVLNLVKKVSKDIPKSFYSNPRLLTSLLDALVKCDDLAYAESRTRCNQFDKMPRKRKF